MSMARKLRVEPLEPRRLLSRSTISTLVSSAPSAIVGAAITFTDHVTSSAGVPTGSVEFLVDGHETSLVQLRSGTASFTDKSLAVGKHTIVAEFVPQRGTVWAASAATLVESVAAQPAPASAHVTPPSQESSGVYTLGGTLAQGHPQTSSGQGATVQLTGSLSGLNDGSNPGSGTTSLNSQGGTLVYNVSGGDTGSVLTQSGTININSQPPLLSSLITSGTAQLGNGATIYSGTTTVGNGENDPILTATQILENSITIPPGQTIPITVATVIDGESATVD